MTSYCLSIHAPYRCAHSGACCSAGWPIAAEPHLVTLLTRRVLGASWTVDTATEQPGHLDPPARILRSGDGQTCVFHEQDRSRCAVHRLAGEAALPTACRNFPRVTLHDRRGVFITLSHYCPTAAALLLADEQVEIVEAPASLSLNGAVEGLDATDVLPPLLRPGMLSDHAGYGAWEAAAIATFNDTRLSAREAVGVFTAATADVCTWSPGHETLASRAQAAFERARAQVGAGRPEVSDMDGAVKRFLAAHLFASWSAYQDGGLPGIVRSVERAFALLPPRLSRDSFVAAIRAADLQLRHVRTDVSPRPLPPLRHH